MENKAIHKITKEDFEGTWVSSDNSIKLFVDSKGYLTISNKLYQGPVIVQYIIECCDCNNCLRLLIGEHSYLIKQIAKNGFYITVEAEEVFLKKVN